MFDPSSLTLGQISSALRDFTVIGILVTITWKFKGFYEDGRHFINRLGNHMTTMEAGMDKLLNNHLAHMESDLRSMAQRQVRATPAEQDEYEKFDQASPE